MTPNRIAVWLTSLGGLSTAVAVPVADMDATSTAGIIGGLGAIAIVVHKWLAGWQKHEEREAHKVERDELMKLTEPSA